MGAPGSTGDGRPLLVTGATGFIGRHLVQRLRAADYVVRAFVRRDPPPDFLSAPGIEIARGDIRNPGDVTTAMQGCRGAIHAAGITGWVANRTLYEAVNYEGTRNLLGAARSARLERVLHVSSIVTIGERTGETATETTRHRGSFFREYERTKFIAEEKARAAARTGLPVVVVNPTAVIGPHLSGMMRQFLESYLARRLPVIPNPSQQVNLVHVDDVATGIVAAYERGVVGERYILGGDNLAIGEMLQLCQRLSGVPAPTRQLPYAVAWTAALAAETFAWVTRLRPPITRDLLRAGRHGVRADSSKAMRELGFAPRPAEDALRDTLAWLQQSRD